MCQGKAVQAVYSVFNEMKLTSGSVLKDKGLQVWNQAELCILDTICQAMPIQGCLVARKCKKARSSFCACLLDVAEGSPLFLTPEL